MRTKKTIRRMTPLARKAAHLSREAHSVLRRLDNLTEEIQRVEMVARATDKALQKQIQANMKLASLEMPRDSYLEEMK